VLHRFDAPPPAAVPPEGRIPRTKLTPKQLREFQDLLLRKRAQLTGDMENMTDQALNRNGAGSGDSTVPVHMADLGSDNWEQELTLGLIESEKTLLREIDAALGRIQDRTFGICHGTHQPIELPRLKAKPWAKYCIEYARLREQGRAP
jgi:RNA polymerase-binding protein DksA